MKLSSVHQLLVALAIALGAIMAVRGLWLWRSTGSAREGAIALGAVAFGVVATVYLRRFRARLAARQAGERPPGPA